MPQYPTRIHHPPLLPRNHFNTGCILKERGLCNIVMVIILGVDIIISVCDHVLANSLCVTLAPCLIIYPIFSQCCIRISPGRSTLQLPLKCIKYNRLNELYSMANGPKEKRIEMGNTIRLRSQREREPCVPVLRMRENTWHTQQYSPPERRRTITKI